MNIIANDIVSDPADKTVSLHTTRFTSADTHYNNVQNQWSLYLPLNAYHKHRPHPTLYKIIDSAFVAPQLEVEDKIH